MHAADCPTCGQPLEHVTRAHCPRCGHEIPQEA